MKVCSDLIKCFPIREQRRSYQRGGYHHIIGLNTWNGVGSLPPPEGAVGLCYFTAQLPSEDELAKLVLRLKNARIHINMREEGIFVRDPSQNGIIFVVV